MNTFTHFKNKLDHLLKTNVRAQLFFQSPSSIDVEFEDGLKVYSGISRCCLIDDEWDYVVKFACGSDAYDDDLCDREIHYYEEALKNGVEDYLAEPCYIGEYKWRGKGYTIDYDYIDNYTDEEIWNYIDAEGIEPSTISISISFYEYPKAMEVCLRKETPTPEFQAMAAKYPSPLTERNNSLIAALFIREYGYEEYKRFADFLIWEGINDLHGGNIGYVEGRLVLIDYAGYYEERKEDMYESY